MNLYTFNINILCVYIYTVIFYSIGQCRPAYVRPIPLVRVIYLSWIVCNQVPTPSRIKLFYVYNMQQSSLVLLVKHMILILSSKRLIYILVKLIYIRTTNYDMIDNVAQITYVIIITIKTLIDDAKTASQIINGNINYSIAKSPVAENVKHSRQTICVANIKTTMHKHRCSYLFFATQMLRG